MRSLSRATLATLSCLLFMAGLVLSLGAQAAPATTTTTSTTTTTTTAKPEKTVEEAYLQESLETMIISEQAKADSKDMKLVALNYARQAIDAGRKNPEIEKSLEYLALESSNIQTRVGGVGKPTNNFPDVRREACLYLGEFPSVEAKNALVRVALTEAEPMVLAAAFNSLGKIGMNDNDEVVMTISYIINRYDVLMPDNSLAFEALVAIERIAQKNGGIKDPGTIKAIMKIADGNYIGPVKAKANDLLSQLRKYSASSASAAQRQAPTTGTGTAPASGTTSGPKK